MRINLETGTFRQEQWNVYIQHFHEVNTNLSAQSTHLDELTLEIIVCSIWKKQFVILPDDTEFSADDFRFNIVMYVWLVLYSGFRRQDFREYQFTPGRWG